ncbi:16212_t:CDS:2, partial [Gigaspora rosea]
LWHIYSQNGSEEDILFNYNWAADPERRNEGGNHIYLNDSSENNGAVNLTQGNNSDNYIKPGYLTVQPVIHTSLKTWGVRLIEEVKAAFLQPLFPPLAI